MVLTTLLAHARSKPYTWLTALLLCISSYLCLVNLDYSLLWDDEAHIALTGRNFLNTGTFTAWDGRNLDSYGADEINMNFKAHSMWPPLMYVFSAAGQAIFGFNEIGARSVHAFIGVLALLMFLLLLRLYLPDNPRLVFFIFLFVALSPQLLLYFRQGHYFSFAAFSFTACFYFYERYWQQNSRYRDLIAMTILGILSFLNHYSTGAATILAIVSYHMMFRLSATSKIQWLMFSFTALCVVLIGSLYLYAVEAFTMAKYVFANYAKDAIDFAWYHHLLKLLTGVKSILAADWLSWSVCLWFFIQWRSGNTSFIQSRKLTILGMLFFVLSVLLSMQRRVTQPSLTFTLIESIDFRYHVAALPLFLVMKGTFISWLINRRKLLASVILGVLLFSSSGAIPFNLKNAFTGESMHGFHLIAFLKEIHRPYRPDPVQEVANYLHTHAKQDDLVHSNINYFRRNLLFYVGDRVLLCCQISKEHRLAKVVGSMGKHLLFGSKTIPDWIVMFRPMAEWNLPAYTWQHNWTAHHIPVFARQTQRPEFDLHRFKPHPHPIYGGIIILKRKDNPANPDRWF